MGRLGRWVTLAVGFALLFMLLATGLSRLFQDEHPSLALALNPLNKEARILELVEDIERASTETLPSIATRLIAAVRRDPAEARIYSLYGAYFLADGKEEAAHTAFERAYELSKTEQYAVRFIANEALRQGDSAKGLEAVDALLRRWPRIFNEIAPILVNYLSTEKSSAELRSALENSPPWRPGFIRYLSLQPGGDQSAEDLLYTLLGTEAPPTPAELSIVLSAMIQNNRFSRAHRLHLFASPQSPAGFVQDPQFRSIAMSRTPFSWNIRNTPGVDLSAQSNANGGLTVGFLNKPVRNIHLQQLVVLPAGDYRLLITNSASGLKLPRGAYWSVSCRTSQKELARTTISEGSYRNHKLETNFHLNDCPAVTVSMSSGLKIDSWQFRYSGELSISSVEIQRVGHESH